MIEVPQVDLFDDGGAVFSKCGTYRYGLSRIFGQGEGVVNFVMLNPSTATAQTNDPTVRRCIGFAQEWGYAALIVTNLYALRSTDPSALKTHPDPVGPDMLEHLGYHAMCANEIICAWGANADPDHARMVMNFLRNIPGAPLPLKCLGVTKDGFPRHPLYLPRTAKPEPYDEPV